MPVSIGEIYNKVGSPGGKAISSEPTIIKGSYWFRLLRSQLYSGISHSGSRTSSLKKMNDSFAKIRTPWELMKNKPAGTWCKGFTLVELIIVAGLVSLVMGLLFRIYPHIRHSEQALTGTLVLQTEARRAADALVEQIREGSEVVRPHVGETTPFLVVKDIINNITLLYLDGDNVNSPKLKQPVYNLVSYSADESGNYSRRVLVNSIKRIAFSAIAPNSVQVNITLVNERGEYQFLSHLGLMNLGE